MCLSSISFFVKYFPFDSVLLVFCTKVVLVSREGVPCPEVPGTQAQIVNYVCVVSTASVYPSHDDVMICPSDLM